MSIRAVIIVPSQGNHAQQFMWSARAVRSSVYGGRAIIVQTEVVPPKDRNPIFEGMNRYQVKLTTSRGKPFSFSNHSNLATMMTISHAATQDGPNLAAGIGGFQPWAAYDPLGRDGNPWGGVTPGRGSAAAATCSLETMSCSLDDATADPPRRPFTFSALRPNARAFWAEIGRSLAADGKIILVGCNLGTGRYIDHVANASGRPTYGAKAACSAADVKTVVRLVRGIERGLVFEPMRRAVPER